MNGKPRISIRARLVRLGLRLMIKRRAHHESLERARRNFRSMEILIPYPPRKVQTTTIAIGAVTADRIVTANRCRTATSSICTAAPIAWDRRRPIATLPGGLPRQRARRRWSSTIGWRRSIHFPAALEDAASSYRWLLDRAGNTKQLALVGDSSGGGLALALMLKLRDEGRRCRPRRWRCRPGPISP